MVKCEIKMKLPTLNEYVDVCRKNKYCAAKYKRQVEDAISLWVKWIPQFQRPVKIYFKWYEKDRRRDIDNVAFAKKFILDALVRCSVLKDDSRRYVVGFQDAFFYGKENKVILYFVEVNESDRND